MAKAEGGGEMSLLDAFAKKCVLLDKVRTPDGEGGYITSWHDGVEFSVFTSRETSMEARRAEKEGVTSLYSCLVESTVPIDYNDYFRDVESGVTYRVTSNPEEKQAPKSAGLAIRSLKYFTAERKEVPT